MRDQYSNNKSNRKEIDVIFINKYEIKRKY